MSAWESILLAFGGQVALLALLGWLARSLGSQWLTRDTERFKSELTSELEMLKIKLVATNAAALERMRHELQLLHTSYQARISLLLDYYATFYRHYRRCQRAANAEGFEQPDGTIVDTKEEFLSQLEGYVSEADAQEGRARLLLPPDLLVMHNESVRLFNQFRRVIRDFDARNNTGEKLQSFRDIDDFKEKFEFGFRELLRTDALQPKIE